MVEEDDTDFALQLGDAGGGGALADAKGCAGIAEVAGVGKRDGECEETRRGAAHRAWVGQPWAGVRRAAAARIAASSQP